MKRLLVTGGSGFIGTNVVEKFLADGHSVLNIDISPPQNPAHKDSYVKVDILDAESLSNALSEFSPTHVIHLAARADLHESKNIEGYQANVQGVENIIRAVSEQPTVERCLFASTKLVCPTDYTPKSTDDYCPDTLYGESKARGEQIVKTSTLLDRTWAIVRPTSIWGPWSMLPHIPYGRFFLMIQKDRYFQLGKPNPPKTFGYVGNLVYQMEQLLDAPTDRVHEKVFYLADYEAFTIQEWADMIAVELKGKKPKRLPEVVVRPLAWAGDVAKMIGIREPPLSSFRLKNMRADTTVVPIKPIQEITGPLPYTLESGVRETIKWLKSQGLISI